MSPVLVVVFAFACYLIGFRLYGRRYLAEKVFQLDARRPTPAHELTDGVDYVPTNRFVLFGHHYASIAGLSPMLGPAVAVIWGWVPALIWVVVGTLLIGAVHDFSALVVSMRAKGVSIGTVTEKIIGPRAKSLFHVLIFFLIALAMGVFVQICATLFSEAYHPEAFYPTVTILVAALGMGWLVRNGWSLAPLSVAAFAITLISVWAAPLLPRPELTSTGWSTLLLGYAFAASCLPVWLLLQPRDYVNSMLLYLGLAMIFGGLVLLNPEFAAPAIDFHPEGAPPLFPFIFIVIACGAISGFHGLVSSGTTAKQINSEADAPLIGYGGMIGESLLGLASVVACTAGFVTRDLWLEHYRSWELAQGLGPNMAAFINGSAQFINQLGLPLDLARSFVALVAISFALTTLDSATRLLRFNIAEMTQTTPLQWIGNRFLASGLAIVAIGFFAFYRVDGQSAGLALWQLFGTTNQVMGALTLLAVTLYLIQRKRPAWATGIPMVFMMVTTLAAMSVKIRDFYRDDAYLLLAIGMSIMGLSLWLAVEAGLRLKRSGV